MLQAAGYRVGLYTSPHLHHLGERIAINGAPLTPHQLDELVHAHSGALAEQQRQENGALTHFEVMTALAYRSVRSLRCAALFLPQPGSITWAAHGGAAPRGAHTLLGTHRTPQAV